YAHGGIGARDAIGGGGRYDHLVEELGGPPTPAVGFALGFEAALLALESEQVAVRGSGGGGRCYVTAPGTDGAARAASIARTLRAAGIACDLDHLGRSLKAQLRESHRRAIPFVLVAGDDEAARGTVLLRDMAANAQAEVPLAEAVARLKR